MEKQKNLKKVWTVLLGIAAALFLVVGLAMVIADTRYISGIQYLFTAGLFGYVLYCLVKKRLLLDSKSPAQLSLFSMGFIFAVVGLSITPGIWALGVILFVAGSFPFDLKKNKA